ncbi:MAG: hypothetical protein CVU39_18670 [Chloroflexi bacterium HGW-Chloroflexi-10]|nr:MAG: hypothetical protein CVU39_18670 [Chloroflexi bacterium HGW-Chloroflexi-10]
MNSSQFRLSSSTLDILQQSLLVEKNVEFGLAKINNGLKLVILAEKEYAQQLGFEGDSSEFDNSALTVCSLHHNNADSLRKNLPWLQPRLLGLSTSAGMGDRLGLATPGHVRATQKTGGKIAPIFAQQSIREMGRTNRTPYQVMDDATWGTFQENWKNGVGADADHLKTTADIDLCQAAGFTFFTIDPGDHVNNAAETASLSDLNELITKLPEEIQAKANDLLNKTFSIDGMKLVFDEMTLFKAMVKYGRAIWHVKNMYEYLVSASGSRPFELEVSVDETDQPTTHAEHFYIASELKRLGVKWVSLAPRYVGRFEKGVEYIGDLDVFSKDMAGHAAIAKQLGPYKLSLHSGSDKFNIYPIAMQHTGGLVHLKTAGTSYLEALHTIADLDIDLLKEIYTFARSHYENDRKSYHVSADLTKAPTPEKVQDWPSLLYQFDAREIFHVTFGTVLTYKTNDGKFLFFNRIFDLLQKYPDAYAKNLEMHFIRHLQPFSVSTSH